MKKRLIIICTLPFFFCCGNSVMALSKPDVLDRDCTAAKAGKNLAMKATVGIGGPCGPADAAKDTAKGAVGLEDKKKGKKKEKGLLHH